MQVSLPLRTIVLAVLFLASVTGVAQQAATPPAQSPAAQSPAAQTPTTISVESKLVNIPVVVRDNKRALVLNLTKADLSLQVDGKPQTIRYFDLDTDLPLTLGLLVDTSESQHSVLDDERSASFAFLDQMLTGKQDQALVIQFAHSVELLQDVTGSRPKLQAALKDLDTPNPNDTSQSSDTRDSGSGSGSGQHHSRGGTQLYDAAFLASDEVISRQKGRKALVILTDGDDRGSREQISDAIEAAQRADAVIYAIYFKGEERHDNYDDSNRGGGFPRGGGVGFPGSGGGGYPGSGGGGRRGGNPGGQPESHTDGKKVLERMARETGGRMFEVSKKQPIADIYAEIGRELRSQYRLGYTPDKDTATDGYHQIELAFTSPDKKKFIIQTREGYYTGK